MKAIIKGFAMFHKGSFDDGEDKEKAKKGEIDKKDIKKIPFHQLQIMERGENGIEKHTISVHADFVTAAQRLDEQAVEVTVDMKETNYNGVKGVRFNFLSGKSAPLRVATA